MSNLNWPIQLYRSPNKSRHPLGFWICDWKSVGIASISGGIFLIIGGHYFDAKQAAKKVLRDGIVRSGRFEFTVRGATDVEIEQIDFAPAGTILEMELPEVISFPNDPKAKPD